jgi:hypothetical protein
MARAIWQKTVTDNTGAPSEGAQITVTIQGGGAATIFSAQAGGTARSNPFNTASDGIARFYAERGYYNVNVFKEGSSISFPWNNIGDKNLFDELGTAAFTDAVDSDSPNLILSEVYLQYFIDAGLTANEALTEACRTGQVVVLDGCTITLTENFIYPSDGIAVKWSMNSARINLINHAQILLGDTQSSFTVIGVNGVIDGGVKRARLSEDFVSDGENQTFIVQTGHNFVVGDTVSSGLDNSYLPNSKGRINTEGRPLTALPIVTAVTDTSVTVFLEGAPNGARPAGRPNVILKGSEIFNARFDLLNLSFSGSENFVVEGLLIQNCANAFGLNLYDPTENMVAYVKNVKIDTIALDACKFRVRKLITENFSVNNILDIGKQTLGWANENSHGEWIGTGDTYTPNNNDAFFYCNPDNSRTVYMPHMTLTNCLFDGKNVRQQKPQSLYSLNISSWLAMAASQVTNFYAGRVHWENCTVKNIQRNIFGSTFVPVENVSYEDMTFINCYSEADYFYEMSGNRIRTPRITIIGGFMRANTFQYLYRCNDSLASHAIITENWPENEDDIFNEETAVITQNFKRGQYLYILDTKQKFICDVTNSAIGDVIESPSYKKIGTSIVSGRFNEGTVLKGALNIQGTEVYLEDVNFPKRGTQSKPRLFEDYLSATSIVFNGYDATDPVTPDTDEWFTKIDTDRPYFNFKFAGTSISGVFGGGPSQFREIHLKLQALRTDPTLGPTTPFPLRGAFAYRIPKGSLVQAARSRDQRIITRSDAFTVTVASELEGTTITGTSVTDVRVGDWLGINVAGSPNVNYYQVSDTSSAPEYTILGELLTDVGTGDNAAIMHHALFPAIQNARVVYKTGGGELTGLSDNQIQDGGTYILPLARDLENGQTITISIPDEFKANEPTVTVKGEDRINYSGGSSGTIIFDSGSSVSITLTSNGITEWRL